MSECRTPGCYHPVKNSNAEPDNAEGVFCVWCSDAIWSYAAWRLNEGNRR